MPSSVIHPRTVTAQSLHVVKDGGEGEHETQLESNTQGEHI